MIKISLRHQEIIVKSPGQFLRGVCERRELWAIGRADNIIFTFVRLAHGHERRNVARCLDKPARRTWLLPARPICPQQESFHQAAAREAFVLCIQDPADIHSLDGFWRAFGRGWTHLIIKHNGVGDMCSSAQPWPLPGWRGVWRAFCRAAAPCPGGTRPAWAF